MKYNLIENTKGKKISLEFYFNKTRTLIYLLISCIIIILILINLKTSIKNNIGSILITILLLFYFSLIDFYEWFNHKKHIIEIIDNEVFINNKFVINKDRIDSIFVEYINSQIEGGWRIYIDNFIENNRYIIKERLSKSEAIEIAYFINRVFNKRIMLIKARGKELIYCPESNNNLIL